MTLRILLQIVPFGDEENTRTIETINVSNITKQGKTEPNGLYVGYNNEDEAIYVIEHNQYKAYDDTTPRIRHVRSAGALALAKKAIEELV